MQASNFWKRFIGTIESGDMVLEIAVDTFIIGWLLALAAIGYEGWLEYLPSAIACLQ